MRHGVPLFVGSLVFSLAVWYVSPLRQIYEIKATTALTCGALGAATLLAGWGSGRLLDRRFSFTMVPGAASFFSLRVMLVLAIIVIAEWGVATVGAQLGSFALGESAYYLVLFTGGIALARWCSSRWYVAPLVAIVVLAVLASWTFVSFVNNSDVNFQYGPERWLFALQNLSGQLAMLPLDVAVAFTAWYLFSRRRTAAA